MRSALARITCQANSNSRRPHQRILRKPCRAGPHCHLRGAVGDAAFRHHRRRTHRAMARNRVRWRCKCRPRQAPCGRHRALPATTLRGDCHWSAQCSGRNAARLAHHRGQRRCPHDVPALPPWAAWIHRPGCPYQQRDSHGEAESGMSGELVQILEGNTFVVSDDKGDIEASLTDPTGLFSFDTRFLSRWVLTVNGQRLTALSTDDLQYFQTRFFLVPGTGTVYVDAKMSVIRQREVADGFHEELRILNHASEAVDLDVRIEAASDFADLFEVKDA